MRLIELDKINKYAERKIHEDKKCAQQRGQRMSKGYLC